MFENEERSARFDVLLGCAFRKYGGSIQRHRIFAGKE